MEKHTTEIRIHIDLVNRMESYALSQMDDHEAEYEEIIDHLLKENGY